MLISFYFISFFKQGCILTPVRGCKWWYFRENIRNSKLNIKAHFSWKVQINPVGFFLLKTLFKQSLNKNKNFPFKKKNWLLRVKCLRHSWWDTSEWIDLVEPHHGTDSALVVLTFDCLILNWSYHCWKLIIVRSSRIVHRFTPKKEFPFWISRNYFIFLCYVRLCTGLRCESNKIKIILKEDDI